METELLKIYDLEEQIHEMERAAALIKGGEVVAFPTETVYGLGADGLSESAVRKIFKAKGRPQDNPLILHVDSIQMLKRLVRDIPKDAYKCMERFWPGPLTMLFRKSDLVPDIITAGLPDRGHKNAKPPDCTGADKKGRNPNSCSVGKYLRKTKSNKGFPCGPGHEG